MSGSTLLARKDFGSISTAPPRMPIFLLYGGVFYNSVLAIVNAHVAQFGQGVVMGAEALILVAAVAYLSRRLEAMREHILLIGAPVLVYTLLFIWVSVANESFYLKSLRDIFIIFIFYLLGTQCSSGQLIRAFRLITLVTIAVLLVEGFAVELYAGIFKPALYYANTRGIEKAAVDSTGLFRNAFVFEGRFSYGLFGQRRLSSIFLEQVSLANYAIVLSIFVMTFWTRLGAWDKSLFVGAIAIMIMSTSSRMGTFMCLLMPLGYVIFPFLPRYSFLFVMPLVLIGSFLFFYNPYAPVRLAADDFNGRVEHTVTMLAAMDLLDLLAGNIGQMDQAPDSGYAYFVYSQTIFGLIYFWYFLATIFPSHTDVEKRFAMGASLFISTSLLVAASIFTTKVSAPLSLVAGYLASECQRNEALRLAREGSY